MTVRSDLEKLLDFYDANTPAMKGKAVKVFLAETTVEKFATKDRDKLLWYRGYQIKPLNPAKAKRS